MTARSKTTRPAKPRPDTRVRKRRFVMVEMTEAEMELLERVKARGGERATYAGTIRDLIRAAAG